MVADSYIIYVISFRRIIKVNYTVMSSYIYRVSVLAASGASELQRDHVDDLVLPGKPCVIRLVDILDSV